MIETEMQMNETTVGLFLPDAWLHTILPALLFALAIVAFWQLLRKVAGKENGWSVTRAAPDHASFVVLLPASTTVFQSLFISAPLLCLQPSSLWRMLAAMAIVVVTFLLFFGLEPIRITSSRMAASDFEPETPVSRQSRLT
jgi:cytochrome c oxidase assembly factor CtaG